MMMEKSTTISKVIESRDLKDFVFCRSQRSWAGLDSPGHSVNNLFGKRVKLNCKRFVRLRSYHLQDEF